MFFPQAQVIATAQAQNILWPELEMSSRRSRAAPEVLGQSGEGILMRRGSLGCRQKIHRWSSITVKDIIL